MARTSISAAGAPATFYNNVHLPLADMEFYRKRSGLYGQGTPPLVMFPCLEQQKRKNGQ